MSTVPKMRTKTIPIPTQKHIVFGNCFLKIDFIKMKTKLTYLDRVFFLTYNLYRLSWSGLGFRIEAFRTRVTFWTEVKIWDWKMKTKTILICSQESYSVWQLFSESEFIIIIIIIKHVWIQVFLNIFFSFYI